MTIKVGKRLFTKDGRRVGNGIVIEQVSRRSGDKPDYWKVETDFGNTMVLNDYEMREFYHVDWEPDLEPHVHSLEEWKVARHRNVMGEPEQTIGEALELHYERDRKNNDDPLGR